MMVQEDFERLASFCLRRRAFGRYARVGRGGVAGACT